MNRQSLNLASRERGLTLVELMIAMALSLFLLAAITYIVVNSNKNYNTTDSLSRLQENARFAMEFIVRDLRRAGYLGCADDIERTNTTLNDNTYGTAGGVAVNPIEGADNIATGSKWMPSNIDVTLSPAPIAGSDAFAVRYLDLNNPIAVTKEMPNESAVLFVNQGHGLQTGDIIAVTDCDGADVMQLTNVQDASSTEAGKDNLVHNAGGTNEPGNSTQKLSRAYGPNSTVLKFLSFTYYVGMNSNNRPALFRTGTFGTEELVEGVESIQITYGEVTGSDRSPTRYSTAAGVTSWQNVVSVRIGLLLGTIANTADGQLGAEVDTGTYPVNGENVDPPDERRLRRVFVSTVLLRNVR